MTYEHERLPRAVELAANIVAGHVRKTETSPDRFASLLMTAFEGIRNLERVAANPGAFVAPALAPEAPPISAHVETPRVQPRQPAQPAPRQTAQRTEAPRPAPQHVEVVRQEQPRQQARQESPRLALHEGHEQPLRQSTRLSTEEDRSSGFVRDGRRTVYHDRLVCLDDGREVTFLGRHLRQRGTSEEDYRQRWNLPSDYPMTTQAYVDQKKAAARRTGFGTSVRPDRETRVQEPAPAPAPSRRAQQRRPEGTLRPNYAN